MISWLEKAKAHFSQEPPEATPETPKSRVMGVLGVPPPPIYEKHAANDESEDALLDALLSEAERVCDHWGDSQAAREQMRQEVLSLAKEQWRDLLLHFRTAYPKT